MNAPALLREAAFAHAAALPGQLPADSGCEVAFAGRSNAGKSSAINALTGRRGLARTSKLPGRTREVVYFTLDAQRRLADLPGYGYAAVDHATRARWQVLLPGYFQRRALAGVVLVMDARHPLRESDRELLALAGATPVHVLLTKSDKLARGAAARTLAQVRAGLAERAPGPRSAQLFSVLSGAGLEEARAVLLGWLAR
jgi:GTP-binding protein